MEERSIPLLGSVTLEALKKSKIFIFGIGGVGGFACEGLARMGVGEFHIIDYDVVSESNLNRQIVALHSTLGLKKVEVMKQRILDINPQAVVHTYDVKINEETIKEIPMEKATYVIDCVDDVKAKLSIITSAKEMKISVLSSMGTGNKLNPLLFQIKDISKTSVCPLARIMRLELRKRNIKNAKVLFSTEEPIKTEKMISSVSFVPSVAGLLIAREVVLDIQKDTISAY